MSERAPSHGTGRVHRGPGRIRWPRLLGLLLVSLVVLIAVAAALAPSLFPLGERLGREGRGIAAVVIFAASYLALAIGRIPGLNIDRAGIALVGASLMVASGALPLDEAYRAIDLDTLTLLLGMMIIVANLRLSGLFRLIDGWATMRARRPIVLLATIVVIAGMFSAFFVNDAICIVLTPIVLDLTARLKRDPIPYILALPMASNAGSVATITGNPQNMIVALYPQSLMARLPAL